MDKIYQVEFQGAANGDFEMTLPEQYESFEVQAENLDEAVRLVAEKLERFMSGDRNQYILHERSNDNDYIEFWFGDEETNQDVCYSIQEAF